MNQKYIKVSLFEKSYKKQMNFFTIFKFFEMYLYINNISTPHPHLD